MKILKIMKAKKIVEENFKGLEQFIKDKDILNWYKHLIVTCMKKYRKDKLKQK